ncbi:zinc finger MYM-type protein 1-like [Macrobrachium rosenbergii]|uniref:zinc finger MYM-type protein 1-like n=1 Tax=Macrobrachium rosenbergii TaxID=79674 RepID=UPI0034D74016
MFSYILVQLKLLTQLKITSEVDERAIGQPSQGTSIIACCKENPSELDYFTRPKNVDDYPSFFKFHPKQPSTNPILQKVFHCKDGTNRKWLSYSEESHMLYCYICIVFANTSDKNIFISGMNDWRHVHQRVELHEQSSLHKHCAEAYFLRASESDIRHLLGGKQISLHREQVRKRRMVLQRIIDVVKIIGKRGLNYRGTQSEACYTLDDPSIAHGNFLELIIFLGKYDICMKDHLTDCLEKSKRMQQTKSKGRGSFVSFLSKTTVNNILSTIQQIIQESIANEVHKARMFSAQIDTTQDLTSQDQCAVVLRYVTDVIHERLVAVVNCEATTGEYFVQILKNVLEKLKLYVSNCIGNATDGVSNMQGHFGDSLLYCTFFPFTQSSSCMVLCTCFEFSTGRNNWSSYSKSLTFQLIEWYCSLYQRIL